jgi:hypothetical protein
MTLLTRKCRLLESVVFSKKHFGCFFPGGMQKGFLRNVVKYVVFLHSNLISCSVSNVLSALLYSYVVNCALFVHFSPVGLL